MAALSGSEIAVHTSREPDDLNAFCSTLTDVFAKA